jgi:hypothetical protein
MRLDVDIGACALMPVPVSYYDEFARTHDDDPAPVPVASKPPAMSRAPQSLRDSVVTDSQPARNSAARGPESTNV